MDNRPIYGGMKHFVIYGVMAALMALASGLGPLVAGLIYDFAGGYGPRLGVGAYRRLMTAGRRCDERACCFPNKPDKGGHGPSRTRDKWLER